MSSQLLQRAGLVATGALLAMALTVVSCSSNSTDPSPATEVSLAAEMNAKIGRGINITQGTAAQNRPALTEDLTAIKEAGFDSIRLIVDWPSGQTIQEADFARIDTVVDIAGELGLVMVLATGGVPVIQWLGPNSDLPLAQIETDFLDTTRQVAEHYADRPNDALVLELLNEPFNVIGPRRLNDLYSRAISEVRASNSDRTLIVGPEDQYNSVALDSLSLPDTDDNIIVAIHNYAPGAFTAQGIASFTETGVTWGGYDDQQEQMAIYYAIDAWSRTHKRPITVNEFGALNTADDASRAAYASFQARQAEMMDFSWQHFAFDGDFGIFDQQSRTWTTPVLDALIPAADNENRGPGIPALVGPGAKLPGGN